MAEADPNIKQITLTQTTSAQEGGSRKRKPKPAKASAQTQKVHKEGGGSTSPGTLTQLASTSVPGPIVKPVAVVTKPVVGGSIDVPVKVLLSPKKKQTKVMLAAPKVATKTTTKTRRVARKIRMSTVGLGKKMTRAKTIRQDASKLSVEAIKKDLVKAALIKADSQAPEEILRQIYSDYMMLKKRAL